MEAKLKSISNRIHWSLLCKAAVFSLAWLILPFWAFFLAAVYFYLVPFFQPFKLIIPFVLVMAVAAFAEPGFLFSLLLGAAFFLLIGIKNLIFVNRFENHQLMVFLILFLVFFSMFSHFENWQKPSAAAALLGTGLSFFFLFKELSDYTHEHSRNKKNIVAGLGSLFVWQAASVLLFLPLNYFYQTALLFLFSVISADVFLGYLNKNLDRRKLFGDFSIFFVISVLILASASWGL